MASTNEECKTTPRPGFEGICAHFNVPAKKGARVSFQGQPGTVTTARGLTVRVRLDGMSWSRPYLPDELQWLDEAPKAKDDGASSRTAHAPKTPALIGKAREAIA
jgi:hypothetical protein